MHALLLIAAVLLVSFGVGLIFPPAGLIVAGVGCGGYTWLFVDDGSK